MKNKLFKLILFKLPVVRLSDWFIAIRNDLDMTNSTISQELTLGKNFSVIEEKKMHSPQILLCRKYVFALWQRNKVIFYGLIFQITLQLDLNQIIFVTICQCLKFAVEHYSSSIHLISAQLCNSSSEEKIWNRYKK